MDSARFNTAVYGDIIIDGSAVTEDAVKVYTSGYCDIFAKALHNLSGYPYAVVTSESGEVFHYGVLTPGGKFVDINGIRYKKQVTDSVDFYDKVEPYGEGVDEWWWDELGEPDDVTKALAKKILGKRHLKN